MNQQLEDAFPTVESGAAPLGHRVLVQIRSPKKKTSGGLILAAETQETEKWNTQIARVVALGPLAFKNRTTQEPWPEGSWCAPGDFVRCPKYGGDRWEVPLENHPTSEQALFVIFNDHELIARVTGDPLKMKAFI
jgi:co-chaperonin GroES (HSP10)